MGCLLEKPFREDVKVGIYAHEDTAPPFACPSLLLPRTARRNVGRPFI
jgi:hypothetical protein